FGPMIRSMNGGSYGVCIDGTNNPTIYATGCITAPLTSTVLMRTVRVTTQILPLFNVALGAVGNINMNGNGMATDSWNSHSTNLSTGGFYDSSKISTNGDVASQQGFVNIGNHTINGNLYLGPTATSSSGTNQILGDLDKNYNVNFPDVKLPGGFSTALNAPILNVSGNKTNWIVLPGFYIINNGFPIVVAPGVNAKVDLQTENFNNPITLMGGNTNAASIAVYVDPPSAGGSFSLAGNATGGAVASTPLNFYIYGLPNMTSIT